MVVKTQIKQYFENLSHHKKTRLKQFSIGLVVVAIFTIGISEQALDKQRQQSKHNLRATQVVDITEAQLFEESVIEEVDAKLDQRDQQIQTLKKQLTDLQTLIQASLEQPSQSAPLDLVAENTVPMPTYPPIHQNQQYQNNHPNQVTPAADLNIPPQWVGAIVHEEIALEVAADTPADSEKKSIVKLPPGFMQGFLLTGMDAMTLEGSSDTPEPMLIRVQAPAVLPNAVRANLKGCFVVAEGYGNLATHRVDARLKSLSCINVKNKTIISEAIKGYVQDEDGKRGIKGTPVHRAGALIARSMIAGAFEGIGNATTASAQITSVSALGQTNKTDTDKLGRSVLGGAIASGAKDVRGLFLQLARQSSPVIEVGSAKKISVVITQLVHLKIQAL